MAVSQASVFNVFTHLLTREHVHTIYQAQGARRESNIYIINT